MKLTIRSLRKLIKEATMTSDFDMPTQDLLRAVTQHMTKLGQTNVKSSQRWERDGVFHIDSSEGLVRDPADDVNYGWYLELTGNDNPHFDGGVTFMVSPKDPSDERQVPVTSWQHLSDLIASH